MGIEVGLREDVEWDFGIRANVHDTRRCFAGWVLDIGLGREEQSRVKARQGMRPCMEEYTCLGQSRAMLAIVLRTCPANTDLGVLVPI